MEPLRPTPDAYDEDARRLATFPGVGPTIASALIAAIGKAETFEHGRDLAAWLRGPIPTGKSVSSFACICSD